MNTNNNLYINNNKSSNTDNPVNQQVQIQFINLLQKQIVQDNSRIIQINGCAGSRKTDTIIKKGIHFVSSGKFNILFLTFVSSVSNEIKNRLEETLGINIPKVGSSNHYLSSYSNNWIEIANIDAWVHKQLSWIETNYSSQLVNLVSPNKKKEIAINFNNKVISLKNYIEQLRLYDIVMKNNEFANVVVIDEFQDTDITKVELLINLVKNNTNLYCVIAGDILQTIFVNSIGSKNFVNPMELFRQKLNPVYYEINTCFRCPAPHIKFVNYLLGEKYLKYGLNLIEPQNSDTHNKPVLFTHDCISKNDTAYKIALGISNTIITLLKNDNSVKPDDIAIIMKKSNSNYVFEHIKNILPKLFTTNNIGLGQNNKITNSNTFESHLIHFETNGDGYTNTINWDKSKGKTVLVSIHGDKGKGHKVIFFLGLSKKSIPTDYNIGKSFEIFDVSLLNVALTRSLKYLFVGFTHNSPSIYLSSKHKLLENFCYLSWNNIQTNSTDSTNIYFKCIKELNKYLIDGSWKKKNPQFNNIDLVQKQSYVPIKTNLNISSDISKDLSGFLEQIVPDLVIEEDCIDFYNLDIPVVHESFYKVFGFVGELLLWRYNMIKENNFGFFGWISNSEIYYTDSDNFVNLVYDFEINKFINDPSLWNEKLLDLELYSIVHDKLNNSDFTVIKSFESKTKTIYITNKYYSQYDISNLISQFCNTTITNKQLCVNPINIIILALLYLENSGGVRRDFLYEITEQLCELANLDKLIEQININCKYVWDNFLSNNQVQFQKTLNLEKKLRDKKKLIDYGFSYKNDRGIFKSGLDISIKGICDIFDISNDNLLEIKTCLKTSFSNEWVLQIIMYNILLKKTEGIEVKNNYIINLFDGSIYKVNFIYDTQVLIRILEFYDFDDFLINWFLS